MKMTRSCCFGLKCIIGDFVDYAALQSRANFSLNTREVELNELITEINDAI
jgi:hypothetical protein